MPRISVITPVYNGSDFIEECILSVQEISGISFEHIIVDDGSTDNTREIVSKYPSIKLLCQENKGATAARNYGLNHSVGEYVKFLDADDILDPTSLKSQYEYCNSLSVREISYGYRDVICRDGLSQGFRKRPCELLASSDLVNLILRNIQISLPLYPVAALEEVGGFDESISGRQEWNLNLRLYSHGWRFVFWDGLTFRQRFHEGEQRISNRKLFGTNEKLVLDNTYAHIRKLMGKKEKDAWASYTWNIGREFLKQGKKKEAKQFFDSAWQLSSCPTRFLSQKYRIFARVFGPYISEKIIGLIRR
ncbi:glycosyltransferase family 2 protein [Marinobacter pelagius]|uniref:Glycosyltransferase involved in cell wall bisynthesis n=1 Tax=Marinobacter pelagius TaxID=379482 RepID=A0A1I4U0V7_9GAMM|nr:glycosyltransferase [Marinobacter pelagius]SFM82698.1 Glycosyltransferase involved in cell wall bisynthesis [Marinobacter pelagius]